jgi:excisionase family DNA binding protein
VTSARRTPPPAAAVDLLLTDDEVAVWLRVSRRTLREWRANRRGDVLDGPPFVMVGGRVRYRTSDVEHYLQSRIR